MDNESEVCPVDRQAHDMKYYAGGKFKCEKCGVLKTRKEVKK